MVSTHRKTHAATSANSEAEGEAEDKMAKHLKEAVTELRELDAQLIDLRKPVSKCQAAIKGVYNTLEKQGYDRELVSFLYKNKRKNRFTAEKMITMNAYSKALGEDDLPLFEVARVNH